jgi:hypothetical protein
LELTEIVVRSLPQREWSGGPADRGAEEGWLRASGLAELDGWTLSEVELTGKADHFWAMDGPRARFMGSGRLRATGRWPALRVRGRLLVGEARFALEDPSSLGGASLALDPRVAIVRGAAPEPPPPVERPWYRDLDLELALDLARASTIQAELPLDDTFGALYASLASILLETRLDGELQVGLERGEVALLGELRPTWGRADILGARFSLAEGGTLTFLGDDPFDPILRIDAVHDAGRYGEVTVALDGSLKKPGLRFGCESWPDETDIASILLFGHPLSALSTGQEASQASLLAAAGSVLVGELERQGGAGHLVDTLELGGGVVKAGRALGDDLFLTLSYDPSAVASEGENGTEATLEWAITNAWSAEFATGDAGSSSAELLWTVRF